MPRLAFIDNLRWTLIILVLSMHASDTYSPFGNWYFTDRPPSGFATRLSFAVYQSFLQAFFMALLFLLAGYFAAPALDRKGRMHFVRDRLRRLGLPTLLYMLLVGPLTQYYLSHTWGTGGFIHQWLTHLQDGEWLSETGPMWFCAALLGFSFLYAVLPRAAAVAGEAHSPTSGGTVKPDTTRVLMFIAVMALATFVARIAVPESHSILNMHFGDFPQFVMMFSAGIQAYRGGWLDWVDGTQSRIWALWALGLSVPLYVMLIVMGGALRGDTRSYDGGLNWVSGGKCLWESLVCVGMSFALLALYRRHFNRQGPLAKLLAENAFAVYLFHPPIIIALGIVMIGLSAPALVKAALLTGMASVATFSLSALVLRRIPVLRRIL